MNIAAASSNRFLSRGWTVSFCVHAVAMVCAVGLFRGLPTHVQPSPLRLDFLLVEPEASPASTPGQSTESELLDPELVELEALSASALAHQPVIEQPPIHPLDTRPVTAPARREVAQPADAHETAPDPPKPVAQPHPVSASVSEEARPDLVDQPSPLAPDHTLQTQTAVDTVENLTDPLPADPSDPPSTLQASSPDQADAKNQRSPPSTQPSAHPADSVVSSAQETPGLTDAPATTVAANHPSVVARAAPSRSDYSWLTDALRRRVESLKTYPHLARVQGWGGRVVVRATIKEDGSLLDARVVESSGHETLDNEAIQLMHRAFPIHLQRDIGKPHVVVMVPIQYRPER